jgi:hypothetical protein
MSCYVKIISLIYTINIELSMLVLNMLYNMNFDPHLRHIFVIFVSKFIKHKKINI